MTEHTRPHHYTQVSSHLNAAGEEVTQLLDLLTEGLALDEQAQRDDARASTLDSGSRDAAPEAHGPGPVEQR
jgi:hypothetical protein